jgi:DNA-binding transcriptional ArsR family regulator
VNNSKSATRKRAAKQAGLDSDLVKALSHPLRMRILRRLNETEASPNEMAKAFGESLPLVSYHVRILRELGCIELVRTTPRRGAIEHHYRATVRASFGPADWAQVPSSARAAMSATTLSAAIDDVRDAVESATFDARPERHLSHTTLTLGEDGWNELTERLDALVEWALTEQTKYASRLRSGGPEAAAVSARLTMFGYAAAPEEIEPAKPLGAPRAKRGGAKR